MVRTIGPCVNIQARTGDSIIEPSRTKYAAIGIILFINLIIIHAHIAVKTLLEDVSHGYALCSNGLINVERLQLLGPAVIKQLVVE